MNDTLAGASPVDCQVRPHAEALKPCPFCGATKPLHVTSAAALNCEDEEEFNSWPHSDSYAVMCDATKPRGPGGCGASGGFFPTEDDAIAAWNKRAPIHGLRFAGWFSELPSGMSYRLWEQGGHDRDPDIYEVALYEA
jgi:Restriction alleviation protein Lar